MFRFADLGRVWWPVQLPYAGVEGGEPVTVHLLFQLLTDDELDARERAALSDAAQRVLRDPDAARDVDAVLSVLDAAVAAKGTDRADLLARVLDWRDIHDEHDQPVPFATDKLAALLAHRPFFAAVRDALLEASREGTAKNSLPGPAGSRAVLQA